ncbi:hypothetical protein OD917_00050 [Flavobacterium sp. SH_e]|uniref:hypothetical protein n=1 Tax=Flavobacterium sp. SH_e TaxID=2983767 RepID=UPI0021E37C99|nr:hypothetical protein [Flavobacterium sp. SH_e]MCV2483297.1 hypothetical protein [Flavobacterium sp. SH_e]
MNNEIQLEIDRHNKICNSFSDSIIFSIFNYQRGPLDFKDNFFLRVSDEFIETLSAIEILMKNGYRNQCRRECRFIIELAIKAAYINQQNSNLDFEIQIKNFQDLLKDPGITIIKKLKYPFFQNDQNLIDEFSLEVRRMYGNLCKYVHTSPDQLKEKIQIAQDRTELGKLTLEEYKILNDELGKTFSYITVLLFNSMPQYVVGDYLEPRKDDYYFNKSKFVMKIDEEFDYKHERKANLEKLKEKRKKEIEF